jgi:hypothetical protein
LNAYAVVRGLKEHASIRILYSAVTPDECTNILVVSSQALIVSCAMVVANDDSKFGFGIAALTLQKISESLRHHFVS